MHDYNDKKGWNSKVCKSRAFLCLLLLKYADQPLTVCFYLLAVALQLWFSHSRSKLVLSGSLQWLKRVIYLDEEPSNRLLSVFNFTNELTETSE